jgi:thiosulfate/3-mercaptopyruvate sulfurtransferase
VSSPLDLVISVDWLATRLAEPGLVVVDVRPVDQYAAGHIPGARSIDLYPMKILDSDPAAIDTWVRRVEAAFRRLGIDHEDRVIFYEDFSGTTAARGVWLMHALTIGEGAMLDGGLTAWQRAGHAVSTVPVSMEPSTVTARLDHALLATADEILASIDDGRGTTVIDTRGDLEWAHGTIPTARHVEWSQHLRADGTLRPIDELRELYRRLDLTPDGEAVTFCASGYRAAHTWLVLRMLGHTNVRNYAPSWSEWGRRGDLPIERTR